MKDKNKTFIAKKKMPFSLKLIFVWMILMVIRGLAKLINITKLENNYILLGKAMAITNYVIDAIILVALVILISMFLIKKRNAWKYFILLIGFMMTGVLISFAYLPRILELMPIESQSFVLIWTIGGQILLLLFYALLIFIAYRKRSYFYS